MFMLSVVSRSQPTRDYEVMSGTLRPYPGNGCDMDVSTKKVIERGRGLYQPNEWSSVVVDILGRYSTPGGNETVFDLREGVSIEIGEPSDELSDILEQCICSMNAGEKCEIEINPLTLKSSLPAVSVPEDCNVVVYSLHLVSFERGKEVWKFTDEERLEIAMKLKTLGTEKFKAGNIKLAAIFYSRAAKYIIPVDLTKDSQQVTQDVKSLRITIFLNLAACQLKFKQYDYTAQTCTKVLQLDEDCVKALYRRGQAHINMNNFEQAQNDLTKARLLEPNNRAIEEQLKFLESKIQSQNSKYRDMLKSMFGSKS